MAGPLFTRRCISDGRRDLAVTSPEGKTCQV